MYRLNFNLIGVDKQDMTFSLSFIKINIRTEYAGGYKNWLQKVGFYATINDKATYQIPSFTNENRCCLTHLYKILRSRSNFFTKVIVPKDIHI